MLHGGRPVPRHGCRKAAGCGDIGHPDPDLHLTTSTDRYVAVVCVCVLFRMFLVVLRCAYACYHLQTTVTHNGCLLEIRKQLGCILRFKRDISSTDLVGICFVLVALKPF